ncbi:DUF47 family protein [Falsiroseomonas selenitidurans]|uniref:DUF47 family protein n=1 Tax=Falsiroseomonas selenitidurans TaxID=2716335 RepID=A0ABX1E8S2_9PROT|nr:DUF47 family protein [Falsiroseomonas selenitidurans]NKC33619.1 DUF47 family protein [Falsiroseomonas selenitidurans]
MVSAAPRAMRRPAYVVSGALLWLIWRLCVGCNELRLPPVKQQILAAIGEAELLPAAGLNAALAANDRLKYAFSLLQLAAEHAEHPGRQAATLKAERVACGLDAPELDAAIAGARMMGGDCQVPEVAAILARIKADLRTMAAPLLSAGKPSGLAERLDALLAGIPSAQDGLIQPATIAAMTEVGRAHADTPHQLVMEMHKRLNAMQAALAEESLDGASIYGLDEADRPLVMAFMAGLHRTAALKFDHPGLATTATRIGDRLVIQNDIGTTDAHVLVIHVTGLAVSVTYTDVHAERLAFFQQLLIPRGLVWGEGRSANLASGSAFTLATGTVTAADAAACCAQLDFIGSRLVFLIDWNRARKALRSFLRGPDRLALLTWAAANDVGHRGFLELGGAQVVNRAIEATAGSAMRFGDRLCDVLGDAESIAFLQDALRTASEGLRAGQSPALLRDRIRVALAAHFSNEQRQLMRLAGDHAGLILELASLVRDGVQDQDHAGKRARRAGRFEHDADLLVIEVREAVHRRPEHHVFRLVLEAADDAADALEDAAFLLDLDRLEGKPLDTLRALVRLLVQGAQDWIKALGHASQIGHAASAGETDDFLAALDRVATAEHAADEAQRALAASAMKEARDFRQLHLFTAIGDRLEVAADALKRASLILRDHVLLEVIGG